MSKNIILLTLCGAAFTGMVFFIVLGALKVYLPNTVSAPVPQAAAVETAVTQPQDPLTIQLTATKLNHSVGYGDEVTLQVHVKNTSAEDVSYGFNNGCNEPDIYMNNKNIYPVQGCTHAFTTVSIEPNETITTDYSYTVINDDQASMHLSMPYTNGDSQLRIEPGTYSVTAKWQDVESEPISLVVSE